MARHVWRLGGWRRHHSKRRAIVRLSGGLGVTLRFPERCLLCQIPRGAGIRPYGR